MNTSSSLVLSQFGKYDNHINASATIKGKFEFSGTALIEGVIYGDVESFGKSTDAVSISYSGKVFGSITCKAVSISGTVVGNIYAKEINLEPNSLVQGDIYYETLGIDGKASVNGRLIQQSGAEWVSEKFPMLVAPKQAESEWTVEELSPNNQYYSIPQTGNTVSNKLVVSPQNTPNTYSPKRVWGKKN